MDQNYTEEEVKQATKLFFYAKDENHYNERVVWVVADEAEWCGKEMNRLFAKFLFMKASGQHDVANAMDETIIRITGWSFDTYLVNTFLRSQSEYDPINDIIKESETTGEY